MRSLTRCELITAIAPRFPNLMAKDAEIAMKEILDAIGRSLAQGTSRNLWLLKFQSERPSGTYRAQSEKR